MKKLAIAAIIGLTSFGAMAKPNCESIINYSVGFMAKEHGVSIEKVIYGDGEAIMNEMCKLGESAFMAGLTKDEMKVKVIGMGNKIRKHLPEQAETMELVASIAYTVTEEGL